MTNVQQGLAALLQNKGTSLSSTPLPATTTLNAKNNFLLKFKSESQINSAKDEKSDEVATSTLETSAPALDEPRSSTEAMTFEDTAIVTDNEKIVDITRSVGYAMPVDVKDVIRECTNRGMKAQDRFAECIIKHNFQIKVSSKEEDINSHIDFFIRRNSDGAVFSVDVKAKRTLKKHEPASNIDWLYIEIKNTMGARGWIHGDADLIAFEREDCFLVVDRVSLLEFLMKRCDLTQRAVAASEAYYIAYTRDNRSDLITMMNINDLVHCKCVKFEV